MGFLSMNELVDAAIMCFVEGVLIRASNHIVQQFIVADMFPNAKKGADFTDL